MIKRHLEITVKNKDQHSITLINSIGYTFTSVCNKGIKCTYRMFMNIHLYTDISTKHHRYRFKYKGNIFSLSYLLKTLTALQFY